MNYLDLFAGLGGFPLGAYWAGMKFDKHYFSEVEPYAVKLYQQRFPDAIPLGDIKEIDCEKLADTASRYAGSRGEQQQGEKPINRQPAQLLSDASSGSGEAEAGDHNWIITGGFPCTDISVAGKGAGIIEGKQSSLWFEYWRVIRELRPRFAIIENVAMLTNRGLDVVLSNLAEIGYDAEWQDIRAEDVGAPHRRERIWIVAYPAWDGRREKRTREPTASGEEESALGNERQGVGMGERTQPAGGDNEGLTEVADTEGTECERKRRASRRWRSELGCSGGWAVEPDVGRLAHGVQNRVDRLKGLGNAIVPQIAELLFRQIKEAV